MVQILTPISLPTLFLQDVLALDVKQLLVVADYQLLEAAEAADEDDDGSDGGTPNSAAAAEVLKTRIPLLIRCLANDRHKTREGKIQLLIHLSPLIRFTDIRSFRM